MSRNLIDQPEESLTAPTVGAHSEVTNLVHFRRGAAASSAPAASDDPLSSEVSIGSAAQAVVLRLANKRIRLRVSGPGREESLDRS